MHIPGWGVRFRAEPTLVLRLKGQTAVGGGPDLGTPTYHQFFPVNLPLGKSRDELYLRLMRTWEKAPRSLAEAAKQWPGSPLEPDRQVGRTYVGLRTQEVLGPATRVGKKKLHLFYATLTAEVWLPMPDGGTAQCHLSWTGPLSRVDEVRRHRLYRRYLRLCRSLRALKSAPR